MYTFKREARSYRRTSDLVYKSRFGKNYKTLVQVKDHRQSKSDNPVIEKWSVSNKLNIIAVQISHDGSDWHNVFFYDLLTGTQLTDTLRNLRSSSTLIWYGNGVYYDSYEYDGNASNAFNVPKGQRLKYHEIGTDSNLDEVLYYNIDTTGVNPFHCQRLGEKSVFISHPLLINKRYYKALGHFELSGSRSFVLYDFLVVPPNNMASFTPKMVIGDSVIISTDWNAPNGKVLKANMYQMNFLREMIPEYPMVLIDVNRLGKNIACVYRKEDKNFITINSTTGAELKYLAFPNGKQVKYFYESDTTKKFLDFCISAFYHPDLWYQMSLKNFTAKPSERLTIPYDHTEIETRYVKFKSKDGTDIPMYITCKKDIKLDGTNPTLIYGYGGYGTTINPDFNQESVLWLLHGGVLAIPNVRGGGAEGSSWSEMGRKLKKQNAIDDFIGAAEFLINERYTNPEK